MRPACWNGRRRRLHDPVRRKDGHGYGSGPAQTVLAHFTGHCADAGRDGRRRGRPATLAHAQGKMVQPRPDPAAIFRAIEPARHDDPEDGRWTETGRRARSAWRGRTTSTSGPGCPCVSGKASESRPCR